MSFIKQHWLKILIVVVVVVAVSVTAKYFMVSTYKKQCAWVQMHQDAVAASFQTANWPGCQSNLPAGETTSTTCHPYIGGEVAKDWQQPATEEQYRQCLHSKGL